MHPHRLPLCRPEPLLALGLLALNTAWAQTAPLSDPASPMAPPSVVRPPLPTPGDDQTGLLRERLLMQRFDQADLNGDGRLSRDEAAGLQGLMQRYNQVDRDKDGMISRDEWKAGGGP